MGRGEQGGKIVTTVKNNNKNDKEIKIHFPVSQNVIITDRS